MRNVSDNSSRGNRNTHFMFHNCFFENRAVYEIMWKNNVDPDRPQITIWPMRIACWITNATNINSEYVILIVFLLQQLLHERASMLRCTYIVYLVHIMTLTRTSIYKHSHILTVKLGWSQSRFEEEKNFVPAGNRTQIPRSYKLYLISSTYCAIWALLRPIHT